MNGQFNEDGTYSFVARDEKNTKKNTKKRKIDSDEKAIHSYFEGDLSVSTKPNKRPKQYHINLVQHQQPQQTVESSVVQDIHDFMEKFKQSINSKLNDWALKTYNTMEGICYISPITGNKKCINTATKADYLARSGKNLGAMTKTFDKFSEEVAEYVENLAMHHMTLKVKEAKRSLLEMKKNEENLERSKKDMDKFRKRMNKRTTT